MKERESMDTVKDRLLHFLKSWELTPAAFEKKCGLSNGYINNMRQSISTKTFEEKIAPNFPQLRKSWLLLGEGDMIDHSIIPDTDAPDLRKHVNALPLKSDTEKLISHLEEQVADLKNDKIRLIKELEEYKAKVAGLELELNQTKRRGTA